MEIDINQRRVSIGDKYNIFIDGQPTYTASRRLFQLMPEISLFFVDEGRPRMILLKRLAWFKIEYDISRWDNNILTFRTKSVWRLHYQCQCGFDNYDIYGHKGRKYSIYKNDVQVAWWDKTAVTWFKGDNYKIIADKDCDIDLAISFCLIIDNYASHDHDGNFLSIDLGNIGPQARKFDKDWQPRS